MNLSHQEVERFRLEGWVVKEGVFDGDALGLIRGALADIVDKAAARLHAEGLLPNTFADEPFERRLACIMEESEEAGREIYHKELLRGAGGGFNGPEMFAMLAHPPLLDCIESLVGPEIVASSVYRVRPKLPNWAHGEVAWHQDSGYFEPHCDSQLIVTCWVPLVDATLHNGCMWVLPNSHKSGVARHYAGGKAGYLVIPDEEMSFEGALPVEMKAGDVLLMTNLTPHCSKENASQEVRWSLDLRYQSAEVPNNVGRTPDEYTPDAEGVEIACYPPEADFVVRSSAHPERETRTAADFAALRNRYREANHIPYPNRWTALAG